MVKKDVVLYEKRGKTGIVTLNTPEIMNAYDFEGLDVLRKVLEDAVDDPEVWTLILTGAGEKAFCAGLNLKKADTDYAAGRIPWGPTHGFRVHERMRILSHFGYIEKPVVAAINGYCIGGGLELAMGCDILIAAEHATFEIAEIKRGNLPGITPAKLGRYIPYNLAMELMLTGRRIDAKEAYRIGLINKVVPLAKLMPTALAVADEINESAPLSVRAAKEVAWKQMMSLTTSEALELCTRFLHGPILASEDSREGMRAFVEKRKPVWKAR